LSGPKVDWKTVVALIEAGDPRGEETLYQTLVSGARIFLQRRLGRQDVDDQVHDIFLTVVETIRRGEIQYPERLMGFVRTVLHRQLNLGISRNVRTRETAGDIDEAAHLTTSAYSPEDQAIARQKVELMKKVLREMSDRDYEVLSRFYLREQSPERVCREMGLSQVQFQLLKSRAKARLADLIRRKLGQIPNPR
jgi:RNA polymerase sigma-70 factor (ECF subfamily)